MPLCYSRCCNTYVSCCWCKQCVADVASVCGEQESRLSCQQPPLVISDLAELSWVRVKDLILVVCSVFLCLLKTGKSHSARIINVAMSYSCGCMCRHSSAVVRLRAFKLEHHTLSFETVGSENEIRHPSLENSTIGACMHVLGGSRTCPNMTLTQPHSRIYTAQGTFYFINAPFHVQ